jgi:hypothetical protein
MADNTSIALPANRTYKSRMFSMIFSEKKELLELKLSDAFWTHDESTDLELRATMLNVNRGHNRKLMEACKTLRDYAEYTARVRAYASEMSLDAAVERAITECIIEGILTEFLQKNRAEAKKVSLYEYDEEKHMRMTREEGYEDGIEKGRISLIQELIRDGLLSLSDAAKRLDMSEEELKKHLST